MKIQSSVTFVNDSETKFALTRSNYDAAKLTVSSKNRPVPEKFGVLYGIENMEDSVEAIDHHLGMTLVNPSLDGSNNVDHLRRFIKAEHCSLLWNDGLKTTEWWFSAPGGWIWLDWATNKWQWINVKGLKETGDRKPSGCSGLLPCRLPSKRQVDLSSLNYANPSWDLLSIAREIETGEGDVWDVVLSCWGDNLRKALKMAKSDPVKFNGTREFCDRWMDEAFVKLRGPLDTKGMYLLQTLIDSVDIDCLWSSSLVHAYTKVEYEDTFWFFDNSKGEVN